LLTELQHEQTTTKDYLRRGTVSIVSIWYESQINHRMMALLTKAERIMSQPSQKTD